MIIRGLSFIRPTESGERPPRGAEPGIQYVGFLHKIGAAAMFAGRRRFARDGELLAFSAVPCRDLVAPPDLPGDAPVADVLHPFEISVLPELRHDLDGPVTHHLHRRFGQRFGFYEPLFGQIRFNHCLAPVAMADFVDMIFNFDQQVLCF